MICNRHVLIAIIIAFSVLAHGCGIGVSGGRLSFDELKYPASMSSYLYGPDGTIEKEGGKLRELKYFSSTMNYWSTFYSLIPLSSTDDIISWLNKEVEKVGGDGLIKISVASKYSTWTGVWLFNLLPIWPGCSEITVSGYIVKYVEK